MNHLSSTAVRPRPRCLLVAVCVRCALTAAFAIGGIGGLNADAAESTRAACQLQAFGSAAADVSPLPLGLLNEPALDESLAYRRGPAGDWAVDRAADPNDPRIACLLVAPQGPIRIDIVATIDGKPFRRLREEWIDAAFDAAKQTPVQDDSPPGDDARPSDDFSVVEVQTESAESGDEADAPPPRPARFASAPAAQWLADYVRSGSAPTDRAEARWMLAQRYGGPSHLELSRFSLPRSAAAPLVHLLDADADGSLSAEELQRAADRIAACDANENGSIALAEAADRVSSSGGFRPWPVEPLLVTLGDENAAVVQRVLAAAYPEEEAVAKPLAEYRAAVAQLVVEVRLGGQPETKGATVELQTDWPLIAADESVTVRIGNCDIELIAGEPRQADLDFTQISLGAIVEGSPLWNVVDADHNQVVSPRELSHAEARLARLDANQDGALSDGEIPTWLRVAVALGPQVHPLLELPSTPAAGVDHAGPPAPPAWFVSMDLSGDGDLTPDEFLGDPAQFAQLDADGDHMISAAEALAAP